MTLGAEVGRLACQRDSSLRSLKTKCLSCRPVVVATTAAAGKTATGGGGGGERYECTFADTVLFPEGGGQPSDRGTINGTINVLDVQRRGRREVVHVTDAPVPCGDGHEVEMVVDWSRRWDHMQQHSGQHLLSAIGEREFGINTVSWALGVDRCSIEVDVPEAPPAEMLTKWERRVNEVIREARPVHAEEVPDDEDATHLPEERENKKLENKEDMGVKRRIIIEGVDANLCCGTHMQSTAQLQAFKFLPGSERVHGTNTRLFFICGDRVLLHLSGLHSFQQQLGALLNGDQQNQLKAIEKLQATAKDGNKLKQVMTKRLASYLAKDIVANVNTTPNGNARRWMYHFEESDMPLFSAVASQVGAATKPISSNDDPNTWLVLMAGGPPRTGGALVIFGQPASLVDAESKRMQSVMPECKGAFQAKFARWQGKTATWTQLKAVQDLWGVKTVEK